MTNLFKKTEDQILIGAYIDQSTIDELDIRALLIKNSRSEVLRYAITLLQELQPIETVLDGLIAELLTEWQARIKKKVAVLSEAEIEKKFSVFLEEIRAELKRRKIVQRYIDQIIIGLKKQFAGSPTLSRKLSVERAKDTESSNIGKSKLEQNDLTN